MPDQSIVYSLFLIFAGAALLATLALYARQALPVAYIVLGALFGPPGLALVTDARLIGDIAHIGIIFLLFLLGLNLLPQKLLQLFAETALVTFASTLVFGIVGFTVAYAFGFGVVDAALIGLATTFSSTILGLKLLPTTVLHHRHTGEIIISVLLLQDMIAILALLVIHGLGRGELPLVGVVLTLIKLPLLVGVAFAGQRLLIVRLFTKFDRIPEYLFLLSIGWCLGLAQLAASMGFSYEIGAFVAGVALATHPVARHIAESLKPLRDFFLVMFFFAIGASFDPLAAPHVLVPALLIAALMIVLKPVVYRFLLVKAAEDDRLAWETGVRLGQMSEFSLLLVFIALDTGLMTAAAASLVQIATITTFVVSAYLIVLRYPTPIATSERLRRD